MFTYLGSIVVFICFLILLTKINKSSGNSLTPADKEIFWVGEILNLYICIDNYNFHEEEKVTLLMNLMSLHR